MSAQNWISAKIFQSKPIELDVDVLKSDGVDGIYAIRIPLTLPDGPEWAKYNIAKSEIDGLDITVRPMTNVTVSGYDKEGYITDNIPVYLNFYTGNTVGEKEPASALDAIVAGVNARGSMNEGVSASFGDLIYKTTFKSVPTGAEGENITSLILDKQNTRSSLDNFIMESSTTVLQKGVLTFYVKSSDLWVKPSEVITAETPQISARDALLAHLERKAAIFNPTVEAVQEKVEEPSRKRSRKAAATQTVQSGHGGDMPYKDTRVYINAPHQDSTTGLWSLRLKKNFIVEQTYHIRYVRNN